MNHIDTFIPTRVFLGVLSYFKASFFFSKTFYFIFRKTTKLTSTLSTTQLILKSSDTIDVNLYRTADYREI